jgi:hypothetical protein
VWRLATFLMVLAGCDKLLGLNDIVPTGDGARHCDHGGAFPAGTPLAIDGAYSVEAARFNPAQTVAYLSLCDASGVKSTCDLYTAFLTSANVFGGYSKLNGVSKAAVYDSYPTITADAQYLIFGSERSGAVSIFVAAAANGSFEMPTISQPALVPGVHDSNEPYILGDGATLYFSASLDGSVDSSNLYRAIGGPPAFGGTATIVDVDTFANEFAPVVTDDELEIFYATDFAMPGGDGFNLDIYTATRASTADQFGPATPLAALSGATIDWPVWISPDNCTLYYINKVHATNGVATVYVTQR